MRRLLLLLVLATNALAQGSPWRTYAGGFTSRWLTTERHHGHDQPWCGPVIVWTTPFGVGHDSPECDASDFRTANLDNSIGFRAGRERVFAAFGPVRAVAGYEGSVSFTEYNLSQRELTIFGGALTAGGDVALFGTTLGVRWGAGPYVSSDANEGLQVFRGLEATIPFRGGLALRVSRHDVRLSHFLDREAMRLLPIDSDGVEAVEWSAMIVAAGSGGAPGWELGASVGGTSPGVAGSSLGLRTAAFDRVAIARELRSPRMQAVLTLTSSAHESAIESDFLGYGGNYRSKTINGVGLGLRRLEPLSPAFTVTWGGGIEGADWRDEHSLLVDGGEVVDGGIEAAIAANAALRWKVGRSIALEASAEQLWWPAIGLGELRYGVGIVLVYDRP